MFITISLGTTGHNINLFYAISYKPEVLGKIHCLNIRTPLAMMRTMYDTVNEESFSYIRKFLATLFEDKKFPCNDTDIV